MANTIRIYVEDPATQVATYTTIRLYRDTTPSGAFTTVAGTATLASTTYNYSITDSSGTADSYYRYTYYHATGPVESTPSEIFQVTGLTLKRLRYEAARRCGAGWQSTTTSAGSSTTLVDATAADDGVDSSYMEGAWLYVPSNDADSRVRRVAEAGFTSSGVFQINPSNTWDAPAGSVEYGGFLYFPPVRYGTQPYSWDDAVNEGLEACWYLDRVYITTGATTGERRFSLSTHLGQATRDDIRNVWLRTTDANSVVTEVSADRSGRYWEVFEDGPQSLTLELFPAPSTTETIVVEYQRKYSRLYNDSDVTICPFELAARAAAWKAMARLNRVQPGKYAEEEQQMFREWRAEYQRWKPGDVLVG